MMMMGAHMGGHMFPGAALGMMAPPPPGGHPGLRGGGGGAGGGAGGPQGPGAPGSVPSGPAGGQVGGIDLEAFQNLFLHQR
jgi:hypothetical protein